MNALFWLIRLLMTRRLRWKLAMQMLDDGARCPACGQADFNLAFKRSARLAYWINCETDELVPHSGGNESPARVRAGGRWIALYELNGPRDGPVAGSAEWNDMIESFRQQRPR